MVQLNSKQVIYYGACCAQMESPLVGMLMRRTELIITNRRLLDPPGKRRNYNKEAHHSNGSTCLIYDKRFKI